MEVNEPTARGQNFQNKYNNKYKTIKSIKNETINDNGCCPDSKHHDDGSGHGV